MTLLTRTTWEQLLTSVQEAGIDLWREGDQLRYRAKARALTPELRRQLLHHKAEILEFLRNADEREQAPPLRIVARDENLPLSFAQQRLWVLDQFEPNSATYNNPMALRLRGAVDAAVLQRCLSEILRRHEALRTCFKTVDGEPKQAVRPTASLDLPLVDLRDSPGAEREETALRLCAEEARRPFDLTRDLLLRAKLLRLAEADHILVSTMHHIASDGWSLGVLSQELSALYEAFVEGESSPLSELTVQYADFAAWQREWLQGEALENQLAYWRKQLKGAPAVLELPTDRPRPAVQSHRGAHMTGKLPKRLSSAVTELSRAEGATPFMTLLAAFQTLLHRYSGEDQIVVGTPIAGRQRPELEPLIGLFINTLVMRGDLSGDPSFRTLLARTREVALGAFAHQDLPFEKLVEQLRPDRSVGHSPLFQAMFILQNAEWEPPSLPEIEVVPAPVDIGISKFDLTLSVREREGFLGAVVEYNTDLFAAETIRRMLGNYQTLLEGIVANPDARLSGLPLLTEGERRQALVEWNRTEVSYPRDRCLHDLIEEQVEQTPEAVAVVYEDDRLTYRQLSQRSNQLARHLQNLGVGPDSLIAICVERSLEMVVGLLGILKAGAAYVPLDPTYPRDRLAFMLEDSGALLLLTQQRLRSQLETAHCGVRLLCLDAEWDTLATSPTETPKSRAGSENLAYVIYTSGSTGKPKGVEVRHRNLANVLCAMAKRPGFSRGDKLLSVTTISFDIAGLELFLPLTTGGQLEVTPASELRDGFALSRRLERSRATVMQATPATWAMLIEAGWTGNSDLRALCGGEAVTPGLADGLLARTKEVWNVYGPTETTIWSSISRVLTDEPITIGRPIANTKFYIVDRAGHPVPTGVPGELLIGGDGVARGYHNRPELSAEKFIVNPFSPERGARLYKTGDLARYRPDGAIEYLGRLDHQVKIRGFRIELGEVESVLAAHRAVREAVVLAREDMPGDKRLVAYLTIKEGAAPKDSELRELLRAKLPEHMVPSAFVVLDRFPQTPNGKVDRKALPGPKEGKIETSIDVMPSSYVEQVLCRIWRERLNLERVGTRDNFFSNLGGHSLLAVRVINEINKALNVSLTISALYQNQTVERLAIAIDREQHVGSWSQLVSLRSGRAGPPVYLIGAGASEHRIAQSINGDRPILLFDTFEWHRAMAGEGPTAVPSIEQLGATCGALVHAHAGSAPCIILGYCIDGKIAFEAAHAVLRAGGKVALVVLLDAGTEGRGATRGPALRSLRWIWRRATTRTADASYLHSSGAVLRDSGRLLLWLLTRAPQIVRGRIYMAKRPPSAYLDNRGAPIDLNAVTQSLRSVSRGFLPRAVDSAGVLIRAKIQGDEMLPGFDATGGWSGLFTRGLDVVETAGGHFDMFDEQNFEALARTINSVLDQYDNGSHAGQGPSEYHAISAN